jgi:hypothetical protein
MSGSKWSGAMQIQAEDQSYYRTRAEQELALASKALHPEAARAHKILAGLYRERIGLDISADLSQDS